MNALQRYGVKAPSLIQLTGGTLLITGQKAHLGPRRVLLPSPSRQPRRYDSVGHCTW